MPLSNFYIQHEYWFAALQLISAMFGMGAALTTRDFLDVAREPGPAIVGCLIQVVAVPLATYFFIVLCGITGGVFVGLALLAAIPGGSVSNIYTYLARGNAPLSVAITSVTTVACLVTTPIILGMMISQYMPIDFQMPAARIAKEITLYLLFPLILGMLLLRFWPRMAARVSKYAIRVSLLIIGLIVVGAGSAGRLDTGAFGLINIGWVCAFSVGLAITGTLFSRLAGVSRRDRIAIDMEIIVRNVNLGLLIKVLLFPAEVGQTDPLGDFVLFTLLLYGALQTLTGISLVVFHRFLRSGPEAAA